MKIKTLCALIALSLPTFTYAVDESNFGDRNKNIVLTAANIQPDNSQSLIGETIQDNRNLLQTGMNFVNFMTSTIQNFNNKLGFRMPEYNELKASVPLILFTLGAVFINDSEVGLFCSIGAGALVIAHCLITTNWNDFGNSLRGRIENIELSYLKPKYNEVITYAPILSLLIPYSKNIAICSVHANA